MSVHYAALLNREIARSRGVDLIPNNLRRANFMDSLNLLPNIVLPMIRGQKVSPVIPTSRGTIRNMRRGLCVNVYSQIGLVRHAAVTSS